MTTVCEKAMIFLHDRSITKYMEDPSVHPDFCMERRMFIESCSQSPGQSSDVDAFLQYWKNKLDAKLNEELRQKVNGALAILSKLNMYCDPHAISKSDPPIDTDNFKSTGDSTFFSRYSNCMQLSYDAMEKLMSFDLKQSDCSYIFDDIKENNRTLLNLLLNYNYGTKGKASNGDFGEVFSTLRLLCDLPQALGSLSFQMKNLLGRIIDTREDCRNLLSSISADDQHALKLCLHKLNDGYYAPSTLAEEDNIHEAKIKVEGLLYRLLPYTDTFFDLCIDDDSAAAKFREVVRAVHRMMPGSSLATRGVSDMVLRVAIAIRSALCRIQSGN